MYDIKENWEKEMVVLIFDRGKGVRSVLFYDFFLGFNYGFVLWNI